MPVIGHTANNGHLSFIHKLGQNDFLCTAADAVHCPDPCHLIMSFQVLRDSFGFFYLGNDIIQPVLCLLIQICQICP